MFLQRISFVIAVLCLANHVTAAESADRLAPLRIAIVGDSTVASYARAACGSPKFDRVGAGVRGVLQNRRRRGETSRPWGKAQEFHQ